MLEQSFDPGELRPPSWRLAAAADIRRRGDALRRRRRSALAAATLVAAVTTSLGVTNSQLFERSSAPAVATTATPSGSATSPVTWRRTVPPGVELDAGMAGPTVVQADAVATWLEGCGDDTWVGGVLGRPVDTTVITNPRGSAVEETRAVLLYGSAGQAMSALGRVGDVLTSCVGDASGRFTSVPLSGPLGDEAAAFNDLGGTQQDTTVVRAVLVVARVGNALVVDRTDFGPTVLSIQRDAVEQAGRTREVVAEMCVFAADPC